MESNHADSIPIKINEPLVIPCPFLSLSQSFVRMQILACDGKVNLPTHPPKKAVQSCLKYELSIRQVSLSQSITHYKELATIIYMVITSRLGF